MVRKLANKKAYKPAKKLQPWYLLWKDRSKNEAQKQERSAKKARKKRKNKAEKR